MATFKFTPIQQQWIGALKSGKYEQTTEGVLFDGKGHCCLGVAARLMAGEPNYDSFHEEYSWDGDKQVLSYSLTKQLGLFSPFGESGEEERGITIYDENKKDYVKIKETSLAELNDNGFSFKAIAEVLTTYPDLYFVATKKNKKDYKEENL